MKGLHSWRRASRQGGAIARAIGRGLLEYLFSEPDSPNGQGAAAATGPAPQSEDTIGTALDEAALNAAIHTIAFEEERFADGLRSTARALANWAGPIPASQANHDSGRGGLIRHSVRALGVAARAIAGLRASMKVDPYLAEKFSDRMKLAVAIAVLYHDAGKIFDVALGDEESVWDPLAEPAQEFCASLAALPRVTWRDGRGMTTDKLHHSQLTSQALLRILPHEVWTILRPVGWWLVRGIVCADPTRGVGAVEPAFMEAMFRIREEADHQAAAAAAPTDEETQEAPIATAAQAQRGAKVAPAAAAWTAADPAADPAPLRTPAGRIYATATFAGILKVGALEEAIGRWGANAVDSPILLGGQWAAFDRASEAYSKLVKEPLARLTADGYVAYCNWLHEEPGAAPKGRSLVRCLRGSDFMSVLVMEPRAEAKGVERDLVFVHALALDGPMPARWMSFPGRIGFKGHGARLNDFRKVVSGAGRDLVAELTACIVRAELTHDEDWFVVEDKVAAGVEYVGIRYPETTAVLVGPKREEQSDKEYESRIHGMWDRLLRLRRHLVAPVWRVAHPISQLDERKLFIFDRTTSEEIFSRVGSST